jgi:hypothetical protein
MEEAMTTKYVETPIEPKAQPEIVVPPPLPIEPPGTSQAVGLPDNPSAHIEEPHPEFATLNGISMSYASPGIFWSGSPSNVVTEAAAQAAGWDTPQYAWRKKIAETMARNGSITRA